MSYVKHTKRCTFVFGWNWTKFSLGISVDREFILIDILFLYIGIEW